MATVSKGAKEKQPPSGFPAGARYAFGAPSARVSLVRLRPRRAGLRFAGQQHSTVRCNHRANTFGHRRHASKIHPIPAQIMLRTLESDEPIGYSKRVDIELPER